MVQKKNTTEKQARVALSLGSNLGDREKNLEHAIRILSEDILTDLVRSSFVASKALDCPLGAADFLNIAVIGNTRFSPMSLLSRCQSLELAMGRPERHGFHDNRIIDIDILLYEELVIETPELTIPHKEMMRRDFVLIPLAEIAPSWIVPPSPNTVDYYCGKLKNK
jgi:2-amino-4-hydroxy-6-hydroxymethyldihydropteridine diphosphokinase